MKEPSRLAPATVEARAAPAGRWPGAFQSRFLLALLFGFAWLGPAWWNLRFVYAMAAWDGLMIIAWLLDFARLPRPGQLKVSRRWASALSLGVEGRVELEFRNEGRGTVQIHLEDDVPLALCSALPRLSITVAAGQCAAATYGIEARARGDHRMGRVFLRYHGPVRLAERWAIADLGQTVRVYPNLPESERYALFLVRSRQIELEKRLKRHVGRGREFESLREYREGDELRDICWTASARRGKLISKVYQLERSQSVIMVVDAGRLMLARTRPPAPTAGLPPESKGAAGRPPRVPEELSRAHRAGDLDRRETESTQPPLTKLDYAVNAALSLAQVALYSGDRVGLVAYGRKIQARLPVARGAAHLRGFLEQLAQVSGELVEADHARAADELLAHQRRRTLVVWLTDLAETASTPEVMEAASRLSPRHLVLFAVVGEPELRALALRRPASPPQMYRYAAALEVIERRELLLRRLREHGVLALEFSPSRLSIGLVNQYLEIKERSML